MRRKDPNLGMKKPITFPLLVIAILLSIWNALAPEPAPKVDFCAQEPPTVATVIEGGNPTNVLATAASCLGTNGFSMTKNDKREFLIEARKNASDRPKNYERVVLWLTRDVAKPEVLKVYMLYGSYIEIFGKGMGRKVLDKSQEDEITSSWKPKLIEAMENARD